MKTSGVCVQFSLRCAYRIEPSEKCVWKLCFGKEEYISFPLAEDTIH